MQPRPSAFSNAWHSRPHSASARHRVRQHVLAPHVGQRAPVRARLGAVGRRERDLVPDAHDRHRVLARRRGEERVACRRPRRRRPPDQRRRLALAARGALQRRRLALVQACAAAQQGESAGGGEGLKVRERRPAAAGDQLCGEVGVACAGCGLLGRADEWRSGAGGAVGGEELGDLEVALPAASGLKPCPVAKKEFTRLVAQHWARDWRALALAQHWPVPSVVQKKNFAKFLNEMRVDCCVLSWFRIKNIHSHRLVDLLHFKAGETQER